MLKIILFKGVFDSLDAFSNELKDGFEKLGHPIFLLDVRKAEEIEGLEAFIAEGEGDILAIFFNHIGLNDYWKEKNVVCFDILVDPPVFYHTMIEKYIKDVTFLCVDENHATYINRFYQGNKSFFLPLAGVVAKQNPVVLQKNLADVVNGIENTEINFQNRKIDVLFTGNYSDYRELDIELAGMPDNLKSMWEISYHTLVENSEMTVEEAVEKALSEYDIMLNDTQLLELLRIFKRLDSVIRSQFRELVIRTLVDAKIRVDVYGDAWEDMQCSYPEYLIRHPKVSFMESVALNAQAKIALNVMPWFKAGFHDRIPSAMLNGAVSVTDSSSYIDKMFEDKKNIVLYDLKQLAELPNIINDLLNNPKKAEGIAKNSQSEARKNHCWGKRAEEILSLYKMIQNKD